MNTYSPTYSDDDDEMGDIVEAYAEQEASDRTTVTDQALAEAWAEGHRTGWEHCQDGNYGNDYWDDPTPNPYAADRPSVTDNARDEEPQAWCPGCGDRIPTEVVRERGVCSNCYGTTDDPWAAARAEMTTATTEDTARAIHRALAPRWMSVAQALGPDQDAYEAMLADIAKALTDAGLLATARTRPTRDELDRVISDGLREHGAFRTDLIADAVLALFRGGDK